MKALFIILCLTAILFKCYGQEGIEQRYASAIRNELLGMRTQAEADRKNLYIVTIECGHNSKEAALGRRIANKNDSLNLLKVKSIIHVYGYPGAQTIGYEANQVLFNIIYRSNMDVAKTYVPIVWQALLKGNATADNYAALADRVSMQESHAQLYGSIVQIKSGTLYVPPILDSVHVDSLRKTIGLPPLKEYLKQVGR